MLYQEPRLCRHPDFRLEASRPVRNRCLLFKPPSLCILLQQPELRQGKTRAGLLSVFVGRAVVNNPLGHRQAGLGPGPLRTCTERARLPLWTWGPEHAKPTFKGCVRVVTGPGWGWILTEWLYLWACGRDGAPPDGPTHDITDQSCRRNKTKQHGAH